MRSNIFYNLSLLIIPIKHTRNTACNAAYNLIIDCIAYMGDLIRRHNGAAAFPDNCDLVADTAVYSRNINYRLIHTNPADDRRILSVNNHPTPA